jgi:hypothetical protein
MKDKQKDYEKIVNELIQDPESYDSWSPKEETDDIRNDLNENIWGDQ